MVYLVNTGLPEGEINGMLYRHSKHDWGDVGKESWAMNDEADNAKQGTLLSSYSFTDGSSCFIETNLGSRQTTVFMSYEA